MGGKAVDFLFDGHRVQQSRNPLFYRQVAVAVVLCSGLSRPGQQEERKVNDCLFHIHYIIK